MRPSSRLSAYDRVLTIQTSVGKVPLYKMIENFLFIEDVDGKKIPFILNEDQVLLYEEMCKQRLSGKPIRTNILKARQLGFSTFIAAIIFCETIFVAGQKAAIVADIAEHATNLFSKYNFFYNNLPDEMKPNKLKSNAKELVVEYANGQQSSIRIMVQGDSAGRSGTYQLLHLSECAFWQDLQSTLVSLLQTVSMNNINSMVFLETTANGVNDYKVRWDNDYSGNTNYIPLFFGWTTRYRVDDRYLRDYEKPVWLLEIIEKNNLNDNQAQWYYDKYLEFNKDLDKLKQEFPSNPVEAFITSGNSVFNTDLLLKRKMEILKINPVKKGFYTYKCNYSLDGKKIDVSQINWVDSQIGNVFIYKEVDKTHPYVVANDPALGGEDYYAVQVFDNYTCEQVAVYHRNKCDADDCAFQMYCLGKYYNDAMITGETNTTSYLLQTCAKCGYKNIYQDHNIEQINAKYYDVYGWKTKTTNRQQMIDLFKIAFRDDPKIINDYATICEMENFQYVRTERTGKEKAQATGGEHDDLVMACCGFFLCRYSQRSVPYSEPIQNREKSIEELEWEIIDKRNKKTRPLRRNVYQIWD